MRWMCVVLGGLVLAGCARFRVLERDVARMGAEGTLRVDIEGARADGGPIVVGVLHRPVPGVAEIEDVEPLRPGQSNVWLTLPAGRELWVAALQDDNRNGHPDEGEWRWSRSSPVVLTPGAPTRISARLLRAGALPPEWRESLSAMREGRTLMNMGGGRQVPVELGTPMDWGNPRVSAAAGVLGLWEPMRALNTNGLGLYCDGRPDPKRTPVVFVHGAAGSPQDFKVWAGRLDDRHQAWWYSYPSGLRLASTAEALNRGLQMMSRRWGYREVHVVAHSMGGLVSRETVLRRASGGGAPRVVTLTTVSTPWSGHEAASLGVKYAPVAVPSWRDIAAGSPFVRALGGRPLPAGVPHHLGYTTQGRRRVGVGWPNDGSVTVASQLWAPVRERAVEVREFKDTHASVLEDPAAGDWIGTVVAGSGR